MARGKKKVTRRRDRAISITGLAESLLLANVVTRATTQLSLKDFLLDGWAGGSMTGGSNVAAGVNQLSLYEMIYGNPNQTTTITIPASGQYGGAGSQTQTMTAIAGGNLETMGNNLKAAWFPAVVQSIAIPVGFRVGKRFLRKPIAMGNKLLKQAGLRQMVKI